MMTSERIVTPEHFDIVIVGGGLSGIDAAYHLVTSCPRKSFVILESRDAIGGTWDLFRKPVSTHRVKPEGMLFGIML